MGNISCLNPLVSVMVPVYNIENYICKCLESLINQTYENVEIILINDCSVDNSLAKIQDFIDQHPTNKSIKLISHKSNQGSGGARLTGLKNASGEWYMFVDGDDYIKFDAIEKLVNCAISTDSDLIVFGYNIVYPHKITQILCDYTDKEDYVKGLILKVKSASLWNKFYKSSLFIDNNIFPEIGLNQGEDYAMTPRLSYCSKRINKLDECLYNYVQYNDDSYTKNFKVEHIFQLKRADDILEKFFYNIFDREQLELMRIRTILYMYKIAKIGTYSEIRKNYKIRLYANACLSKQDKLIVWLINKRLDLFIRVFSSMFQN